MGAAAAVGAGAAGVYFWRRNRGASTESGPETTDHEEPSTNPLYDQPTDNANPLFLEPEAGIE